MTRPLVDALAVLILVTVLFAGLALFAARFA